MAETNRIIDQLQRAFNGDAWSGPSLLATLQDMTAAQAVAQRLPQVHSIWEIVLHLTAWMRVAEQRIRENRSEEMSAAHDWPALPQPADEAAWQQAQQALAAAHGALLAAAARLSDADLDREIGATSMSTPGTGTTNYVLLHGVAQHNLYHAGQVALLKKVFV
ncbi:DUF664 domain-containing protein [Hymenobacter busanensis]|uniref:DUF664 domain-containing protein n=1 Tax=Hymenobacter busanensis TaxID=2607656 RepID=A0A7L5A1H9_9BACT|nr:DinB family protein [Hymenobacter busanensis]KAA9338624.1 DUF664 domain-containing protein [Hymenobacter busanensis]QHJ08946.1 DUF664 domain-containing protein [Hymenobacter busanensis]